MVTFGIVLIIKSHQYIKFNLFAQNKSCQGEKSGTCKTFCAIWIYESDLKIQLILTLSHKIWRLWGKYKRNTIFKALWRSFWVYCYQKIINKRNFHKIIFTSKTRSKIKKKIIFAKYFFYGRPLVSTLLNFYCMQTLSKI